MRLTTGKIDAATSASVQTPAYLVELNFSTILRFCNRGTVNYDGNTYYQGGIKVGSISTGEGGVKTVQVQIPNNQFAFSTIVLAETASGRLVRIWKLFGDPPYDDIDAQLIFTGLIDDVPELYDVVTMNCSTPGFRTSSIPNLTVGPPWFNFLPRSGETIDWDGERYTLTPR